MALETLPWDPAEHLNLKTAEDLREYLEAAFEDGDPALIAAALGDVARARGMTEIAREAGISREAMYKAFRPEGNPTLDTLARVIRALGLSSLSARLNRAIPPAGFLFVLCFEGFGPEEAVQPIPSSSTKRANMDARTVCFPTLTR